MTYAKGNQMFYVETSAKENINLGLVFQKIAESCLKVYELGNMRKDLAPTKIRGDISNMFAEDEAREEEEEEIEFIMPIKNKSPSNKKRCCA